MKIKIYNESWNVTILSQKMINKKAGNLIENEDNAYGLCNIFTNDIYLVNNMGKQRMKSILTHEVTHAINAITQRFCVDTSHEELCDFVATHIDEINKQTERPRALCLFAK